MTEAASRAVLFGVLAWLGTWLVSLTIAIARGPLMIGPVLDWIIVLVCLLGVLAALPRPRWLVRG